VQKYCKILKKELNGRIFYRNRKIISSKVEKKLLFCNKNRKMKYFIYSFLAYWVYHRFFASSPRRYYDNHEPQPPRYQEPRQRSTSTKKDDDFIEYEEIK
jgi:hypothetical protein